MKVVESAIIFHVIHILQGGKCQNTRNQRGKRNLIAGGGDEKKSKIKSEVPSETVENSSKKIK